MKRFLLIALLLTGCSSVPTSGPISPGLEITTTDITGSEGALPQPPRAGMSQQEVVAGFLAANSNSVGDFTIAREYLADFVASEWVPSVGIQVFEPSLDLQQTDTNTITAVGVPKLNLDAELRPTLVTGIPSRSISFSLIEEKGHWRITNPPQGTLLSTADFQRNYQIATLWFVDRQLQRLVPDFIAISQRNDPATQLIRALTSGSSDWVKPATINFVEFANSGGLAGVQRYGERVIVDLESPTLRLKAAEQNWLISQLAQTLVAVPGISELEVTVSGQPLQNLGIANPVDLTTDLWLSKQSSRVTNLYSINKNGRLIQLINQFSVRSWSNQFPNANSLAVNSDEQRIAIALPDRAEIVVGDRSQTPQIIAQVAVVRDLNFDASGKLWFLNQTSRVWFGYDGVELQRVSVPVPTGDVLSHVMIGPDNIRVGILSESGTSATLAVARLVSSDRNITLKDALPIATISGEVKELSWFSATEIVLLVKFPNQIDPVALIVDLATAAQTIVRLPAGVQQMDTNGFGTMMVIDQTNRIWQRSTGAWEEIGGGSVAAYPRK